MDKLYNDVSQECSKLITKRYSTSFSLGIRMFEKKLRPEIYAIYGFVRFADEIVDTFDHQDKEALLMQFKKDTYRAIEQGVSLNPVLHSFQRVVRTYNIDHSFIDAFIASMQMDLTKKRFTREEYETYIYGSAEVVGLMCLKVFVENKEEFDHLMPYAKSLGSAFQKINFLRDIKSDYIDRGRIYFPGVDMDSFCDIDKEEILREIKKDFDHAYIGVQLLPRKARLGVYLAYKYYLNLLKKISLCPSTELLSKRIRVRNRRKLYLLTSSSVRHQLGIL